jgi:hypothetical protein
MQEATGSNPVFSTLLIGSIGKGVPESFREGHRFVNGYFHITTYAFSCLHIIFCSSR